MAKNIVVFSDGTGQEGGKNHNTNVYKLFNMIEDRTDKQIVFYDRGLGTGRRRATGKIAGMGISKNIQECYEFIFNNYNAGDRIFLFGFSRGATTVRSLSGLIHYFGILPKSRPELIKQAYKIYKKKDKGKREERAKAFVAKHHTMWCRIHFLGVWDTVAALGIPIKLIDALVDKVPFFRHKFHDLRLSESVEHAYHALAIDDERKTFHPTVWDNKDLLDYQTVKQVWFCGMHTDVGGGYKEQELSDIALVWMVQRAVERGLRIYPHYDVHINQDANGTMHDSRKGWWQQFYQKATRTWNAATHGKPVIHESVLKRTFNKENKSNPPYDPWITHEDYEIEPWQERLPTSADD